MPAGSKRNEPVRRADVTGAISQEYIAPTPDQPNMMAASNYDAREAEKPEDTEASKDTKDKGQEMKINRIRMQFGADDVRVYLLRVIREKQENKHVIKVDVGNVEGAVCQFMGEYLGKTDRPPPYLCDEWSNQIYKDPVVTPSGFTYERIGIEDHLKNVGEFDPITHVKLTADLLIPDYVMRKLVDAYMLGKPNSPMPSGCDSSGRLGGPEPY